MPTKKTTERTPINRVWIELEKPRDDAHAKQIVDAANRMLKRLRPPEAEREQWGTFSWDAKRAQFGYGSPAGYAELADRGEWFNLDYLGRE